MKISILRVLLITTGILGMLSVPTPGADASAKIVRGWLADEGCARGRASSGVYTETNPDCAKKCVAKGSKIVLVAPDEKKLFMIENQEIAQKNVGDYVEVSGNINPQTKSMHVNSLKFLEKAVAKCDVPPRNR